MEQLMEDESLVGLIEMIIKDKDILQRFLFFVNRLGRTYLTEEKLEEIFYRGIQNGGTKLDLPLSYYLDDSALEHIAKASIDDTGVKLSIGIQGYKQRYAAKLVKNDKHGNPYQKIVDKHQEGDEIFEVVTPYRTWKQLCGFSFVTLERNGESIASIRGSMN